MRRHPRNEDKILYPKSLFGQREYKRATPRFVAISDLGICLKWNKDVTPDQFEREAIRKLQPDAYECGLDWDVCVLYRTDLVHKERKQKYFRIHIPFQKNYAEDIKRNLVIKQIKILHKTLHKLFRKHIFVYRQDVYKYIDKVVHFLDVSEEKR